LEQQQQQAHHGASTPFLRHDPPAITGGTALAMPYSLYPTTRWDLAQVPLYRGASAKRQADASAFRSDACLLRVHLG